MTPALGESVAMRTELQAKAVESALWLALWEAQNLHAAVNTVELQQQLTVLLAGVANLRRRLELVS